MNKCASVAGHFNGHANALKQWTWHCPMQQIQVHTRCPWKPPSGDYLLRIAPAVVRVTGKQTTIYKYTCNDGHFDDHGNALVHNRLHRLMPPLGKYYVQLYETKNGYNCFLCIHRQIHKKRSGVDAKAPVFNKGIIYQSKEKSLTKVTMKFVGEVSYKNNIWWSGCLIAFVFIGTVSRAQLWTSIKTCNFVTFYEFLP
jgi:hypothetical protein